MPRRGRVPGVENYSPEDVKRLLEIIGAVLPTGANEWEVVLHNYEDSANKFDRAERELTSLKKKFSGLLNVKKPTGACTNEDAPDNVRPSTPSPRHHVTAEERQCVLTAYESAQQYVEGCYLQAVQNWGSQPAGTWRHTCKRRQCTEEMVFDMETYLEADSFQCQALSAKLTTKLKTLKQEKSTCNSDANKMKRFRFPKALVEHQDDGDYIVYFDKTNYDPFCMRSQGRAAKGKRAAVKTPPSKGKIFQIQFVVSVEDDLVLHQLQRGSILMSVNADFVQKIYLTVKNSEIYSEYFCGKKVVIVLDNAPAHNQTEARVEQELGEHSDLVLLRLGPYSPMLNPIEGCFSVFKSKLKTYLSDNSQRLFNQGIFLTMTEARMA
ncbi:hypothetical protein F443_17424 [Phytophthora nicotianae P1569]|uniref:Uncharacterized protein n=2 Tax=Phytophthora nicotianae TaxID=4792 RepID=V9EDE1_PHYNI|nr:hypothetical protein F443_17424 [Phytophthora nicotianae P1569]